MRRIVLVLAASLALAASLGSAQSPDSTELYEGYNLVTYPENFYQGWPVDWQPIAVASAVYRYEPGEGWLGWFREVAVGHLPPSFNAFWTLTPGLEYWVFVQEPAVIEWHR